MLFVSTLSGCGIGPSVFDRKFCGCCCIGFGWTPPLTLSSSLYIPLLQQYNLGRGAIYMANVTLTSAFVYLASQQAGCLTTDTPDGAIEIIEDCRRTTYGMIPASLIINIQVISGILNAFWMPYIGAIVDCTHYRRTAGATISFVLVAIQAAQIGTTSSTWFVMAILQGIAGALFEFVSLVVFSYLPDMARNVGEKAVTGCTCRRCDANFAGFIRVLTSSSSLYYEHAQLSGPSLLGSTCRKFLC